MPLLWSLPIDFDPKIYLELNPDIAKMYIGPRWHFRLFGRRQQRPYKKSAESQDPFAVPLEFDNGEYLDMNRDVAATGMCGALHYSLFGRKEGRFINLDCALSSGIGRYLETHVPAQEGSKLSNELDNEIHFGQLIKKFESLGDNCEFGLLQRACGSETIGLLRFNFCRRENLLAGIKERFCKVKNPDDIKIRLEPISKEYIINVPVYGMSYHTFLHEGSIDPTSLKAQEFKRFKYMVDKLFDDFEDAEKIFVRKELKGASEVEILELFEVIRQFGEATLLWVVPDDPAHPSGTVEVVRQGLLKGYIDRFAPGDVAGDISFPIWLGICRSAHELKIVNAMAGSVIRVPAMKKPSANFLPDKLDFVAWNTVGGVSKIKKITPSLTAEFQIFEHEISAEKCKAILNCEIDSYLEVGKIYVFSAFVFIPLHHADTKVEIEFEGGKKVVNWFSKAGRFPNSWQRIWVSLEVVSGSSKFSMAINICGAPGSVVYSAKHRVDRCICPAFYRPLTPGVRPAYSVA